MAELVDGDHPEAVDGERLQPCHLVGRLAAFRVYRWFLLPVTIFTDAGKKQSGGNGWKRESRELVIRI